MGETSLPVFTGDDLVDPLDLRETVLLVDFASHADVVANVDVGSPGIACVDEDAVGGGGVVVTSFLSCMKNPLSSAHSSACRQ